MLPLPLLHHAGWADGTRGCWLGRVLWEYFMIWHSLICVAVFFVTKDCFCKFVVFVGFFLFLKERFLDKDPKEKLQCKAILIVS